MARRHTYLCECSRRSCRQRLQLDVDLYHRIRVAGLYLVADGHQPLWARTVKRGDGWIAVMRGKAFRSHDQQIRTLRRRLQPHTATVRRAA